MNLQLSSEAKQAIRDWFLVGRYTGQRFGDWPKITRESIDGDYIHIIQGKTGRPVTIPIHPDLKEVFEKYNYQMPKLVQNQPFNRDLKEICKNRAKKWPRKIA